LGLHFGFSTLTITGFCNPLFWRAGWRSLTDQEASRCQRSEQTYYRQTFQHDGGKVSQKPRLAMTTNETISGMGQIKKKGGGGNAHDRKVLRDAASKASDGIEVNRVPSVPAAADPGSSFTERAWRAIENPFVQTPISVIGGIVGVFIYGPVLILCSISIFAGVHRSGALRGLTRKQAAWSWGFAGLATIGSFAYVGKIIETHRDHIPSTTEIAEAVRKQLPAPIDQKITNIYNSIMPSKQVPGEPRIDLSEFTPTVPQIDGMHFENDGVNNGTVPALDVGGTAGYDLEEVSHDAEEKLFGRLERDATTSDQPLRDQPMGEKYVRVDTMLVPASVLQRFQSESNVLALYLGRVESYRDARGNHYLSEECEFIRPRNTRFNFCGSHNLSGRLVLPSK
jgi:hypothetical protein